MGKWLYQQATILYDPDTGAPVGFFGGDGKEYMCQFGDAVPISLGGTVDEYSLLPAAASHALENWLVTSTTGIWPFRKSAGLWRSNGSSWSLMMDYDELVNQINVNTANIATKQDQLVSTINIKSINGASILGSGDLVVSGGGGIADGDKGDITVSGSGAIWTIDNDAVTFAKMQNVATASFIGRTTAGTGDMEVLTSSAAKTLLAITSGDVSGLGALATLSSVSLTTQVTGTLQAAQAPAYTGDATSSAGSLTLTIPNNTVTNAKAADMAANTIKGNNTGSSADPADLTVTQVKTLLNYTAADVGAAAIGHTHTLASVTDVTMTVTNLNSLDDGVNSTLHFHDSDRSRANHTGTQTASTISDLPEAVQDIVGAMFVAGTNTTPVYNDGAGTIAINATGGGSGITAAEYYARQTQFYYGDHL